MSDNKLPRVAVLMSTYNGEKYIRKQIDSILSQKSVDITLIIHDDGSSDSTLSIVYEFIDSSKVVVLPGTGNLGPGLAFMTLLKESVDTRYDYYAFADQDDIWKREKLICAIEKIRDISKPVLYCSNQILYIDENETRLRFSDTPDLTLIGHINQNMLSGCTMVLNSKLAGEIVKRPLPDQTLLRLRMHDAMVFLVALLIGEVVYDENAYIKYRIHESNVVGVKKTTLFSRMKRLINMEAKCLRSNTAKYLLENYPANENDRKLLEEFALYQTDKKNRRKLFHDNRIYKKTGENMWLFKLKILMKYV